VRALLPNLLLFGRVLRGLGLRVDPGRMLELARALEHVGLRRDDVYAAARALCVRRREELALFDAAFEAFWRAPARGVTQLDLRALGERRRFRRPRFASSAPDAAPDDAEDAPRREGDVPLLRLQATWSAHEVLRHKDFAALEGDELRQVERLLADLAWRVPQRLTRRRRAGRGTRLDLRGALRASLRRGGEVLERPATRPRLKPRPLVVLADVSGSMERYTRLLLLFMYGLTAGVSARVEAFVFSTRLTRVTRALRSGAVAPALAEVARAVPGGTRIGDALRAFNFGWARRVLGGGSVVLLVSDGWDRGDPQVLAREMARLRRGCARLVWLNPLLGSPGYEPLARGMQAALPHLDDFLPVHNLSSVEDLARRLERLDARAGRRPRPRPARVAGEARRA
jgi:hypothetical protein